MNWGLIILTFISVNLDFFVMMLFLLRKYSLTTVLVGYLLGTLLLVTLSFAVGKFLAAILPEWLLGVLGFLPLWLAVKRDDDTAEGSALSGVGGVLLTYLSICAGCNLSLFLPVLAGQPSSSFFILLLVVGVLTVLAVVIVAGISLLPPIIKVMDQFGEVLMRGCYLLIGCYVIYDSGLLLHLLQWIR